MLLLYNSNINCTPICIIMAACSLAAHSHDILGLLTKLISSVLMKIASVSENAEERRGFFKNNRQLMVDRPVLLNALSLPGNA
jgi:hypothetical protein